MSTNVPQSLAKCPSCELPITGNLVVELADTPTATNDANEAVTYSVETVKGFRLDPHDCVEQ